MKSIERGFLITIICCLTILNLYSIYIYNESFETEKELETVENKDLCSLSINCENSCNKAIEGDSFLTCRYQCLTYKYCEVKE